MVVIAPRYDKVYRYGDGFVIVIEKDHNGKYSDVHVHKFPIHKGDSFYVKCKMLKEVCIWDESNQ